MVEALSPNCHPSVTHRTAHDPLEKLAVRFANWTASAMPPNPSVSATAIAQNRLPLFGCPEGQIGAGRQHAKGLLTPHPHRCAFLRRARGRAPPRESGRHRRRPGGASWESQTRLPAGEYRALARDSGDAPELGHAQCMPANPAEDLYRAHLPCIHWCCRRAES